MEKVRSGSIYHTDNYGTFQGIRDINVKTNKKRNHSSSRRKQHEFLHNL